MNAEHDSKPQGGDRAAETKGIDGAMARLLNRPLTEADLREQTQRVGQPPEQERQRGASLLVFCIGDELLAFPAKDVARVTRAVPAHRIPHRSNAVIRGLCNIDGELMLCASLASLLDIETAGTAGEDQNSKNDGSEEGWIIILREGQDRWAVVVDLVHGLENVNADELQAPPMTVERALVKFTVSILPIGDNHAALLDTERLFSGFRAALR